MYMDEQNQTIKINVKQGIWKDRLINLSTSNCILRKYHHISKTSRCIA